MTARDPSLEPFVASGGEVTPAAVPQGPPWSARKIRLEMLNWLNFQGAGYTAPRFNTEKPETYRPTLWAMVKEGIFQNNLPAAPPSSGSRWEWSFGDPAAYPLTRNGQKMVTKFLRLGILESPV